MKKKFLEMGAYYISPAQGLVRTVCRADRPRTDEHIIVYVSVGEGGCASECRFMPEKVFENIFLA